jgi:hypothetical protein
MTTLAVKSSVQNIFGSCCSSGRLLPLPANVAMAAVHLPLQLLLRVQESPAVDAAHLVASYAAPPANTAMAAALQLLQAYFPYMWPSAAFLLSSRLWSGAAGQYGLGGYFFPVVFLLQVWPSAAFLLVPPPFRRCRRSLWPQRPLYGPGASSFQKCRIFSSCICSSAACLLSAPSLLDSELGPGTVAADRCATGIKKSARCSHQ